MREPDCYILNASIVCCTCAKKYMDKAMSEAQETKVCPACNAPGMVPLANSPDMHKPPLSRYTTTGDELHCNACGLTECFESDHDADTDDWPQAVPDLNDPNEGGEYCDMCCAEIVEPTYDYRAAQSVKRITEEIDGDAFIGNDPSAAMSDILRALLDKSDEWSFYDSVAALCPTAVADAEAAPNDPEEMLLTCIRKCASMHTSPRAWLADGNLARIIERL